MGGKYICCMNPDTDEEEKEIVLAVKEFKKFTEDERKRREQEAGMNAGNDGDGEEQKIRAAREEEAKQKAREEEVRQKDFEAKMRQKAFEEQMKQKAHEEKMMRQKAFEQKAQEERMMRQQAFEDQMKQKAREERMKQKTLEARKKQFKENIMLKGYSKYAPSTDPRRELRAARTYQDGTFY